MDKLGLDSDARDWTKSLTPGPGRDQKLKVTRELSPVDHSSIALTIKALSRTCPLVEDFGGTLYLDLTQKRDWKAFGRNFIFSHFFGALRTSASAGVSPGYHQ